LLASINTADALDRFALSLVDSTAVCRKLAGLKVFVKRSWESSFARIFKASPTAWISSFRVF
jgi:hypothetical protein